MSCTLCVSSLNGASCALTVGPEMLIADIKQEIEELTGIPSREQLLLRDVSELLNEKSFGEVVSGDSADLTLVRLSPAYASWLSRTSENGRMLKHAPKWARADRRIVLAAVRENPKAFAFASADLRADDEIASLAMLLSKEDREEEDSCFQRALAAAKLVALVLTLLLYVWLRGGEGCHEPVLSWLCTPLI
eukprot:TRINITY_DN56346_c0_g1_i1.p1 TRINITY_DN56346_c0_g1~~TRINITY_DN56346_c0_g1_i1.p1  ORF type:complete len:216 (-),score=27.45 TRINITY_DN56346_c0_g1_i1:399-971(-)